MHIASSSHAGAVSYQQSQRAVALPKLSSESRTSVKAASPGKTLFVGDSYTHGHFDPVRTYGADTINDLNKKAPSGSFAQEGAKGNGEKGPWGGIPALFQAFSNEQGLKSSTSMEAVSATDLSKQAKHEGGEIGGQKYNTLILQDKTNEGLNSASKAGTAGSELQKGVGEVSKIVRAKNPAAKVYVNENPNTPDTSIKAGLSSSAVTAQDHNNFSAAAKADHAKMAPVGDAFQRAISEGVADPKPATVLPKSEQRVNGDETLVQTPAGTKATSTTDPTSSNPNISSDGKIQLYGEDDHHPSSAGAYLSALTQYGAVTKIDPRSLGANDQVAKNLDIPSWAAAKLQTVAAQQLTAEGITLHRPPT